MKLRQIPVLLLGEILVIVALIQAALVLTLPSLAPHTSGVSLGVLNAAMLAALAAPWLYWRCMHATRMAASAPRREDVVRETVNHSRERRRAYVMTAAAQILGLLLTATAAHLTMTRIQADAREQYDHHVDRIESKIKLRAVLPLYGLKGARGIYMATGHLSRDELRRYVDSRDLAAEFPGARGFGFIERVRREDLPAFVAAQHAEGVPSFNVTTKGDAADLYIIKHISPLPANQAAVGFDAGATATRKDIERAVDTGEPTATGKTNLRNLKGPAPGFLYLVPVFRQGSNPTDAPQRRAALVGLLYAPIVAADLFDSVASVADGAVAFDLLTGEGVETTQMLYTSQKSALGAASSAGPLFEAVRKLSLSGRDVTLRTRSTPAFEAGIHSRAVVLIAAGGAFLSLLLALTVWSLAAGRMRAQTLAARMTIELDRLAQVVRHTSNSVTISDAQRRIVWINEGFTRISGYSSAEALGRTPGELLACDKADPGVLALLESAAVAGESVRAEVINRAKDGREYWIDTEVQPLRDAQGQVTGFMEIGSDITDKRDAARELARERQRLDNILRGTNVGTWEWNPKTGITEVNERWAEMLGYARLELEPFTARTWTDHVHPDDVQRSQTELRRHLSGASAHYECELRLRHKLGHWIWVLSSGSILQRDESGNAELMVGTQMDISERKSAEDHLRRNHAMLQAILENLPCGLSVFDSDLRMQAQNSQFRVLLDLSDDLFKGDVVSFESIIRHNAERGEYGVVDIDVTVAQIVERARHPTSHQFERTRPDGRTLDIRGVRSLRAAS